MPLDEVFQKPTVTNVVFQIRFPNLFFLEQKIGDFQVAVMEKFPESSLAFRRQIMLLEFGPNIKIEQPPQSEEAEGARKIWQFKSKNNTELNLLTDSLDVSSKSHKTYNNPASPEKFRDSIQFVVDSFLSIAKIPIIHRLGLRYIDDCPVPAMRNQEFSSYYNSGISLERFNLEEVEEVTVTSVVKRGRHKLRYAEALRLQDGKPKLILDYDGYAENFPASEYLAVTDELHGIIEQEYERSIKEPVFRHMRGQPS